MRDISQELIYSHGLNAVIKRETKYGILFSIIRKGSPFFVATYNSLLRAIEEADTADFERVSQKDA